MESAMAAVITSRRELYLNMGIVQLYTDSNQYMLVSYILCLHISLSCNCNRYSILFFSVQ